MTILVLAFMAANAQVPAFDLGGGVSVSVNQTGTFTVRVGQTEIPIYLMVQHDGWKYCHQSHDKSATLTPRPDGSLLAEGDVMDGDGNKVIHFRETVARADGRVDVSYDLARATAFNLDRGVQFEMVFPRPGFNGRRQFVAPAVSAPIPSSLTAGGSEYWVQIDDTRALVFTLASAVAWELSPGGATAYIARASIAAPKFTTATVGVSMSVRPLPAKLPGEVTGDNRALALSSVTPARATVPRFGFHETRLDLAATYDNPFDPDQIAVDAHITAPSGRRFVVPCFFMIEYTRRVTADVEELTSADTGSWRLRFTPAETGRYSFYITAHDRSGEVTWRGGEITAQPSSLTGFVRTARNRHYFELSTGQPLFPIGHNLPTCYVERYLPERELAKMRAGGENYNRWWMYSQELGLERMQAPGWYRQTAAFRMDHLLGLAADLDFHFMLCMDTHQDFLGSQPWEGWPNNPYNAALGGPCQKPSDFFTNAQARDFYRKRLRYTVARFGFSPRVLCWEFGNEFEGWPDTPPPDLLAWHREMSDYLRSIDPYGHLITTSFWTPAGRPEVWNLPNIDIVQTHHYPGAIVDMARMVAADCREKREGYDKPHIYGEIGLGAGFQFEARDKTGVYLHNSCWAALMSGAASSAMSWWHENYIDALDLYHVYRGLAEFVRGVPLSTHDWRPVQVAEAAWIEKPNLAPGDLVLSPMFGWGKPEVTRFELSPRGEFDRPDQVTSLLQGRGHPDLRTPLTFVANFPVTAKLIVHVDEVSNSGLLRVSVDGAPVAEWAMPCGEGIGKKSIWQEQWKLWQCTYDRDYEVDIPAGRHEITLLNDGADWVRVAYYKITGVRTYDEVDHLVLGMRSPGLILLWVRNDEYTWYNVADGKVRPRPAARLALADVPDGSWLVERWDTRTGKVLDRAHARAAAGRLDLTVPALAADVAYKIVRE
jgi:hypothetical protein